MKSFWAITIKVVDDWIKYTLLHLYGQNEKDGVYYVSSEGHINLSGAKCGVLKYTINLNEHLYEPSFYYCYLE